MSTRPHTGVRKKHALQLFKTDMCKYFLEGRCENGDFCSYAHDSQEVRNRPDLTCTSMCRTQMKTGVCNNKNCRFAHTESDLRATHGFFKMKMCVFAQSRRCKHGNQCRFAHSPDELRPAMPASPEAEEDELLISEACKGMSSEATSSTREVVSGRDTAGEYIFGVSEKENARQRPAKPSLQRHMAMAQDSTSSTTGRHSAPRRSSKSEARSRATLPSSVWNDRNERNESDHSADGSSWNASENSSVTWYRGVSILALAHHQQQVIVAVELVDELERRQEGRTQPRVPRVEVLVISAPGVQQRKLETSRLS